MGTSRRALLVGIQEYQLFGKLDYARDDAALIREVLTEYEYQFSCTLLLDQDATSSNIRMHFKALFEDADEDAILIFFYAGHGVTVSGSTYLITLEKEDSLEESINLQWLINIISHSRKQKQTCVFILDCCHAGALPVEDIAVSIDKIKEAITSSIGVTLMAATESHSVANESTRLEQGIFTHWLFSGLSGGGANADGKVTILSLYEFVSKGMAEFHKSQKTVLKTTTVGDSPVLGSGFAPQTAIDPSALSDAKMQEIDNMTRERINLLSKSIQAPFEFWMSHVHKETSIALSELVEWRSKLKNSHPELKTSQPFLVYENEIIPLQTKLANLQVGTVLPEGVVERKIGEGGFGSVYAVQTSAGIQAYKVYHANTLHDKDKVKAFMRGYSAMKKLDHPNIVRVIQNTSAPLGFFMQHIDGQNFRDWWSDDPARYMNVLHIIAQTLEHAHLRGVVHRDIKPENILIANGDMDRPVPYLTDFDLAWYSMATVFSSTGTSAVSAFGHYLYAAPEQYESPNSEITRKPASDIYGFGQLCYFAICGKDPARDGAISTSALKERLHNWTSADAARKFVDMYAKCIKRTPSHRYRTMNDVSTALIEVRNLLLDPDNSKTVTYLQFLDELVFSIFGFDVLPSSLFSSRSQRTQVELSQVTYEKTEIKFDVMQGFLGLTGSYDSQKAAINKRIDDALDEIRAKHQIVLSRHNERAADVYSTRIQLPGNYLTLAGVAICREVIGNVISRIEL
jgi:serine/threonine protein kinase